MTPQTEQGNNRDRILIEDVARDAGVSRSTVSLVLRGNPVVAKHTAEKVGASILRLGYVYNRTAATLRSRKSHSIGLIEANFKNPFFPAMSEGVEQVIVKAGRALLFANTYEQVERQTRAVELMLEYNVDGLLICPARNTRRQDLDILTRHRIPFVFFSRYIPGWETDYVGGANLAGAVNATRHLVERGHRRLVFVGGDPASSPWLDRTTGFRRALEEFGIPVTDDMFYPADVSIPGGDDCARRVLARDPLPTAALCYSDSVAFGFMMGLGNAGVEPGKDFSIIGFDDLAEAALWRPPLSTVACPPELVGVEAARLLLHRIGAMEEVPIRKEISGGLKIRQSSSVYAKGVMK